MIPTCRSTATRQKAARDRRVLPSLRDARMGRMSGRFCSAAKTARQNKANRNGLDPCGVSRSFAPLFPEKDSAGTAI